MEITPGTWKLWDADEEGWFVDTALELGNDGPVAQVRAFADACLIAAAPDLLAACMAAEAEMDACGITSSETLEHLRAAIAKAAGGL